MKFRRQHPSGIYTLDFYCAEASLAVEIEEEHHFTAEGQAYDAARDRWLASQGIEVLRFTGKQVDFLDGGCVGHNRCRARKADS